MNKFFRSTVCLLLILILGLAVTACAKNEHSDYESNLEGNTPQQNQPPASSQDEPPASSQDEQTAIAPSMSVEEFFSNAAFIGDSVTLKLRNYNAQTKILGDTTFLC